MPTKPLIGARGQVASHADLAATASSMTLSSGQGIAIYKRDVVATATTEIRGKKTCTPVATGYANASGMRSKPNQNLVKDTALSAAQDEARHDLRKGRLPCCC